MDLETFERRMSELNKPRSKPGPKPDKYKCECGYSTGRKFNLSKHKEKCRLNPGL